MHLFQKKINLLAIAALFFSLSICAKDQSILLIINYTFAYYQSIPLLKKIYQPYFGDNIVFYGEQQYPDVIRYTIRYGQLSYLTVADAIKRYPGYDGYLFLMDDCILNTWLLHDLDKSKIWFAQNICTHAEIGKTINSTLGKKASTWMWWTSEQCGYQQTINALKKLKKKYKRQLTANLGKDNILASFSDIAYIPARYAKKFTKLANTFGKEQVFLEIAFPTIVHCLADKKDIIFLPGTGSYDKSPLQTYDPKVFFNHPVKLSKEENQQFIDAVFSQLT